MSKKVKTLKGFDSARHTLGWMETYQNVTDVIDHEQVYHYAETKKFLIASDGHFITVCDEDAKVMAQREWKRNVSADTVQRIVDKLDKLPKNWTDEEAWKVVKGMKFAPHE